ncbi:uncharacterized protein K441DRAFT_705353 [Cenococcum geophilum 1.58]|uniref:uncharacterized protein n=1 Tax=Cenococcum geophilum 1.58 TaxID=794803 RepID=UPI003590041E|nr:hypothetical protein K441DRAFT_705353 [Cenococcum geophilum 1.58]
MKCLLPPHQPLSFSSYEDYDVHYQKNHVNRCSECHKNFPSDHYLGLHIAENHDSLNEARRARGEKTYACFVSDCDRLCSTPQKRRLHVIDKHQFPKYYDFFIVNDGLGKRNSMLRPGPGHRRRSSAATVATARQQEGVEAVASRGGALAGIDEKGKAKVVPPAVPDAAMEDITSSLSAMKFVPPSIKFGRGRGRGGLARS